MPSRVISAPTAEPVTRDEAKLHVGQDQSDDDDLIAAMCRAARAHTEEKTGRALVAQTRQLWLDDWPRGDTIRLPRPPLRKVVAVRYYDTDDTVATLAATNYDVDGFSEPGRVVLSYGSAYPSTLLRPTNSVVYEFVCGYEVPFTVNASTDVITAAGHWFVDDERVRVRASGGSDAALPTGLSADTDYYVISASGDTLQLSATSGGSAIDISDTGTGTFFIGAEETPPDLRAYINLLVGAMYAEREVEVTGTVAAKLTYADHLWRPYRVL